MPRTREARTAQIMRSIGLGLALVLGSAACQSRPDSPDLLLLITVDTLRADRLGAYGSDRGLSPNLDSLAVESVVFTAAYAPAAHTVPSVISLLTGRYPQEIGVWNNYSVLSDGVPTLASELADRGWRTSAVVSNWVLREDSGVDRGFGSFDDELPQLEAARPIPERVAIDTTNAALSELNACGASPPCFLWVHYQDPHGPYTPPGDRREQFLAREREEPDGGRLLPVRKDNLGMGGIPGYQFVNDQREVAYYRAGYDGEIQYVDEEIGRLLAGLAQRGLAESALIVFAADHGEGLGENDYWFAHGEHLTDTLVHVPLFIRAPGTPPARRDDIVSFVDLFPTLLALAVGAVAEPAYPGRSLFAPDAADQESTAYLATLGASNAHRRGLVRGDYKFIVTLRDSVWSGQLFRRGREDVDLAAPAPQIAAGLRDQLAEFFASLPRYEDAPAQQPSEADRAKLEALGYVDGKTPFGTPADAAQP